MNIEFKANKQPLIRENIGWAVFFLSKAADFSSPGSQNHSPQHAAQSHRRKEASLLQREGTQWQAMEDAGE